MSGYRVYISAKDRELLVDMFNNDVNFSDYDKKAEAKKKLIDKILDRNDQERIKRCK